jgi:hypothetical protein
VKVPLDFTPESQRPSPLQQTPEVVEWALPDQTHCTVSPARIVVVLVPLWESEKAFAPPGPTSTVCMDAEGGGVAPGGVVVMTGCVGGDESFPQETTASNARARGAKRSDFMRHLLNRM